MEGVNVVSDLRRGPSSYGGLELVSDLRRWPKSYDGLEVVVEPGKEVPITRSELYYVSGPDRAGSSTAGDGSEDSDTRKVAKRVCGVRAPVFWLLLVIAVVVVVFAAVGGGVGGYYLINKNNGYGLVFLSEQ
jgi:hypothetical protein